MFSARTSMNRNTAARGRCCSRCRQPNAKSFWYRASLRQNRQIGWRKASARWCEKSCRQSQHNQRCSQLTARRCDSDCSDFFFGFTLGGGSNALIMGQGDKNGAATWTFHTNRGILISNYLHSKLKYRRTAICMIIW